MEKDKINLAKQEALEQENKILKEQIAVQEKLQQETAAAFGDGLSNEIKKIRQKGFCRILACRRLLSKRRRKKNMAIMPLMLPCGSAAQLKETLGRWRRQLLPKSKR